MKTYCCHTCNRAFEGDPVLWQGRDLLASRACPDCVAKHEHDTRRAAESALYRDQQAKWQRICPPLYQDTDFKMLPESLQKAVCDWSAVVGLGMVGKAGSGKTRAAFEALRRQHYSFKHCFAITGSGLHRALVAAYGRDDQERTTARCTLVEARTADFLLLDDIGKQKFTDANEAELFDLLDHRFTHYRPTIWTTNSTSKELGERLSTDRGSAIIRRLCENTTIVKP